MCPKGCAARSDVFTILRKGTTFFLAKLLVTTHEAVFNQNIHGRTDIIIFRYGFENVPCYHNAHVRVCVEIKTIKGHDIKGLKMADSALRDAALQLAGLNTQNCEVTPAVLLV